MMQKGFAPKVIEADYTPALVSATNVSYRSAHYLVDSNFMMDLDATVVWSGAAGGGGGTFTIGMPTGWIIETARLSNTTATAIAESTALGTAHFHNQGVNTLAGIAVFATTGTIKIHDHGGGTILDNAQGAGDGIKIRCRFPVKAG